MVFHESRCLALIILFAFAFVSTCARSWDMAVAIGQEIDFLASNGTLIGETKIAKAKILAGLAYDDITHTIFFSDTKNSNGSIFSLNITDKNTEPRLLLKSRNGTHVIALVFDSETRTLFWADALKQTIMKMHIPLNKAPEDAVVVQNLMGKSPRTVTIDMCNRHLYWGNANKSNASIERSNLDGGNRITIIKDNLYEPVAVAVDHATGKLYWIDDEEGIHYKIERSDLDGSNREFIFHGKHQQPVHISVDNKNVYWIDWVYNAAWMIDKSKKPGDIPKQLRSYHDTVKDANPTSVITRDNSGKINCEAFTRQNIQRPVVEPTILESFNNLTTSTEESDLKHENLSRCSNNGLYVGNTCYCKPGFSGFNCEISACHNYCLQGTCRINPKGLPVCHCNRAFSGFRCERNDCHNYCLNHGQCSINKGKPSCTCRNFAGARCESKIVESEMTVESNLNSVESSSCRCMETNQTLERLTSFGGFFDCGIIIPVLSSLVGTLTVLVISLSYYVTKLRRRPRIKKRFVVSRSGNTPLTSRPQIPSNQCEITIENCCNMNICETPCFEPKLRNSTSRMSRKEEKNGLLDNMEGNGC
ncbi:protein cueball isoform X2 [Belonocnema kinseyi]|uniref:protein cueball isoform X2 n=1 Tax=Belonocnema kinseyi TaxID=2817044 RepID=UPI00143D489A|nr:protein cueball isoform X2 [Belonocnema kinseyi]